MKRILDKFGNPKDIPTVSKQQFTADFAAVIREFWPKQGCPKKEAGRLIEDVIEGRNSPSILLTDLARKYGAKPGRVGNFLRGLR